MGEEMPPNMPLALEESGPHIIHGSLPSIESAVLTQFTVIKIIIIIIIICIAP